MVLRSIYFDSFWWKQAKAKAQKSHVPLAVVVRQLLKAWVKGDVTVSIDDNGD